MYYYTIICRIIAIIFIYSNIILTYYIRISIIKPLKTIHIFLHILLTFVNVQCLIAFFTIFGYIIAIFSIFFIYIKYFFPKQQKNVMHFFA